MPAVPSVKQILRRQGLSTLPIPTREVTKAKKANKKRVKAGDKISGTVSDEAGPLMGATVCEIDGKGRIVESAITDVKGHFTMRIKNPQDRLRFSYVGMITVIHAINRTKFKIVMQSATQIKDVRVMPRRSSTDKGLPIPIREVVNATERISMPEYEGLGIVEDEEGVSNENNPRRNLHLSDDEQALVTPVNDLSFNMLRKVGSKESILLSSLGMTYALGLINNGAAGQTRKQINKVLGCDDKKAANINDFCHKMLTESSKLDKLTKMEITNEFFSHKTYKPKSAFKEVAIDYYDTKFKESESGPSQGFALVNTIHFKGIWTDKFRKANTHDEVFKDEDGKETTVPMMNQTCQFFYTENDLCQTLCLPYSNGAYQMFVLLPKEGKTVGDVVQSLTADGWGKCYDQMRRVLVEVKLPRFESKSEVILTDVMKKLGMPDAFSMTKADFSNLFDMKSWIDKVKQFGRIEVDETGTEATVVTALQGRIVGLDLVQPDTIRFHATHPFLYFVREWSTGTIFFIGQYMGS
jgi:serpin B